MEKGRKNMLIAAGAAFAGGVAVTLTVLALAFCPAKRHGMWHGGWHRDMPRAEMRLPTRHHPEGALTANAIENGNIEQTGGTLRAALGIRAFIPNGR